MKKELFLALSIVLTFSCSNQFNISENITSAKAVEKKADTQATKVDIGQLELETLAELNLVRKSPKEYAKKVLEYKKYYNGNELRFPGEITIITNEGEKAVDECYNVLNQTPDLTEFKISAGLSKAAKDLVDMQSGTNKIGHTGSDGSSPFDRMDRYGKWGVAAAENVDYGNNVAEKIVMSLLIDDGVSSRGHRESILNPELKFIGLAYGSHKAYNHMFVMDFAGDYKEK